MTSTEAEAFVSASYRQRRGATFYGKAVAVFRILFARRRIAGISYNLTSQMSQCSIEKPTDWSCTVTDQLIDPSVGVS